MQPTAAPACVTPAPEPLRWRRLGAGVAGLLLALILAQPLLCVLHCRISASEAHAHRPHADGQEHFLCNLMPQPTGAALFVPAFWPGLAPALLVPLLALALLLRRLPPIQPPARSITWAPLTPPPR